MANPAGESKDEALKLDFDRRVMLQFRGSVVTSDAGLLAYRELDDALGLSTMAGETLADARTGKNERHALVGLLRQSVFGESTSASKLSGSSMRSAFRPTRSFRTGSAIYSSARSDDRRARSGGTTPISPTRRQAGPSRAG